MIITHLRRIGLLLLCITLQYNIAHSQTLTPQDFTSPTTVKEDLFGFNGGFMMEVCGATTDSIYVGMPLPLKDYHLLESCVDFTNKLNPNILRFPGGTGANYYHFNGTGYGFQFWEVIGSKFEGMVAADARLPVNHIENFADLCLQSGTKAIYVLNLLTHYKAGGRALTDPTNPNYIAKLQENLAAIDYLIDRGVEVVGVELGNELYAYFEINGSSGTRNQYMNLARVYTDSLKQRFPGMQVGMPLEPVASLIDIYFNEWNKMAAFANFADAYILHAYEKGVMNFCSEQLGKEDYFNCAKEKIDNYLDVALENNLGFFWQYYGRSKPIWLTEWNILDPQRVGNSYLHAYFIQKHWNVLMELEKKYPGDIGFTNCHNFISGGYLYPSVGYQQPNESPSTVITDQFSLRSSYYANLMMTDVLRTKNKFIGKTSLAGNEAWVYKNTSGQYYLVFNNDDKDFVTLQAEQINNLILDTDENLGFIQYSSLSANAPYDACGINYYNLDQTNVENELNFIENVTIENTSTLTLPGTSISVITIAPIEEVLPLKIDSLYATVNDCEINLSWTSENDNANISYVIYANNKVADTVSSLGTKPVNHYNYLFVPEINQVYTFHLEAIENNSSILSALSTTINIECIPLPDATITGAQLSITEDCQIAYAWTVIDQVETNTFVVSVSFNGSTATDTVAYNASESYNYTYPVLENGSYDVQITIFNDNEVVSQLDADNIIVDCIEIPEASITNTQLSVTEDCQLNYTWTVIDQVATNAFEVSVMFNGNTFSETVAYNATGSYQYTFPVLENGSYDVQITILNDNELVGQLEAENIIVDCIEIPEASITNTQLSITEDCQIAYAWTVIDQVETNSFMVSVSFNGSTATDTVAYNATGSYNYTYPILENGSYDVQITVLNENELVNQLDADNIIVDCIEIPHVSVTNTQLAVTEDCQITYTWTVIDQVENNAFVVSVTFNGNTFSDTVAFNATGSYNYNYSVIENGSYDFQITILNDNEVVSLLEAENITVDCIEIPDPIITFTQLVLDDNCNVVYTWRVENHTESTNFIIATTIGNTTTLDTIASSMATLYSYTYIPEENGDYSFQIALLDGEEFLSATTPDLLTVGCIVVPPMVTNFTATKNEDCSYTVSWSVINEQIGSSYQLLSSVNGAGFSPINLQFALGNFATFSYHYTIYPDVNGSFDFQLKQFMNGNQVAIIDMAPIDITCAPLPDPELISFQVIKQNNCSYNIEWTVNNEVATSSYKLFMRRNNGSVEQIHTVNSTENATSASYQYNFVPELNGNYKFEIEQYNEAALVTTASYNTIINCVMQPTPEIINFTVLDNGDCTFDISWTTLHERSTVNYTVFVNLDSDSLESIYSVESTINANNVNYQFTYSPELNGVYEIVIQQFDEGILIDNVVSTPISINCIPSPDPEVANFTARANDNCTFELSWDVVNEQSGSLYKAYARLDNGTFKIFETIYASATTNDTSYTINYTPAINGNYTFKMEQYHNNTLINSLLSADFPVNCVPSTDPFIESFDITNNGDCTFEIAWSVSNEISSTSYLLLHGIVGEPMDTIYATASNGEMEMAYYGYTFVPTENHPYDFQVIQLDNNEFISSSDIATAVVNCINVPEPILNSFTATSNDDCSVDLSWEVEHQNTNTMFVINESFEGSSFMAKAVVQGNSGPSTQTFNYNVPVNEAGEYSYHLEVYQNDSYVLTSFDESAQVYCPQNVYVDLDASRRLTFGEFTLTIFANQPLQGELKFVNVLTGLQVLQETISVDNGFNDFEYNFDDMPGAFSGLYVITFTYPGGSTYISIVYI